MSPHRSFLKKFRVMVVDAQPVVRLGISTVIGSSFDMVVDSEFGSLEDAVRGLDDAPDLVILDLHIEGGSGFDFLAELKKRHIQAKVLVFSGGDEDLYAVRCIQLGATGYLTKGCSLQEILDAARRVLREEIVVSPRFLHGLVTGSASHNPDNELLGKLTQREIQIYRMIAANLGNKEIAGSLGISARTVDAHCRNIISKLNLKNLRDLVRFAAVWSQAAYQGNAASLTQ